MINDPNILSRFMSLLHHRTDRLADGEPVAEPIVATSVFSLPENPAPDRIYARPAQPTVQAVEARLAQLEGAPTLLFPSGMGAYGALLMAMLRAGDRVLMLSDGYYAGRDLVETVLTPFGVELITCPADDILEYPLDTIALVVIETPSNPGLTVIDIAALVARCRDAQVRLLVDNTVCTPLLQNPLDLGADAVICSDTKAMGGHSDLLMGHVASKDSELMAKVHQVRSLAGAVPAPFEAWLLLRGLETLELRLGRMCANARAAQPVLAQSEAVLNVTYPVAHAQAQDQGFLVGAEFKDAPTADRFLTLAGLTKTTSFGGLHSSGDRRARYGDSVPAGYLRLSFGIEPTELLVASISRALDTL